MARQWRVHQILGGGPQSLWDSDTLGSPGYQSVAQWFEGETLLRVRVQGQLTFAVHDTDPSSVAMGSYAAGGQSNTFGVWAKKDGGASTPPLGVPQEGSLDPAWSLWDQMTLLSLSEFSDALNENTWTATYAFPGGGTQSFGRRGPATADTDVWLVYGFNNVVFNPPFDSSFTLTSFYAFGLTVECLFDHVIL